MLPWLTNAPRTARDGTRMPSPAGHPPLSSALPNSRRLVLDPRVCNTGVYNPH